MLIKDRKLAEVTFTVLSMKSGRIPMRLGTKAFRTLDTSEARTLRVTYVLTTSFGTFTTPPTLKR